MPEYMFEDVYYQTMRRHAGARRTRLSHLLEEDAFSQVASAVEEEGQLSLNGTKRAALLRQIREQYKKRVYPQETYESWHCVEKNSDSDDDDDEPPSKRSKRASQKRIVAPDFDAAVRRNVLDDMREKLADAENQGVSIDSRAGPAERRTNIGEQESSSSESESSSDDSSQSDSSDESGSESDMDESNQTKQPKTKRTGSYSDDADSELDADDTLAPGALEARKILRDWAAGKDASRSWLRDHYTLHKSGYEVSDDMEALSENSIRRQHVSTLTTLLHVKVLQKDWHVAYKVFAVLSKIPRVDMRSLWPLGVEILTQLRDEARARPEGGSSGRPQQIKLRSFFDWLALYFPPYNKYMASLRPNQGPVFRTGSKSHAPMHSVVSLWNLLSEKQYTSLRDKLDELLLVPPYNQDGVFHYMKIVCCLSENANLLTLYQEFDNLGDMMERSAEIGELADDMSLLASKKAMKARIFANHTEISDMMEKCEACRFEVPKEMVNQQMDDTRAQLAGDSPGIDKAVEKNGVFKKKNIGYSFQKGKVIPAKTGSLAVPEKYLSRLIVESDKGGSKSWFGEFFDYSKRNKAVCLVCGTTLESRKNLDAHLASHNITPENQKEKLACLKEFDMAEMVKRQGTNLSSAGNKTTTEKAAQRKAPAKTDKKQSLSKQKSVPSATKARKQGKNGAVLGETEPTQEPDSSAKSPARITRNKPDSSQASLSKPHASPDILVSTEAPELHDVTEIPPSDTDEATSGSSSEDEAIAASAHIERPKEAAIAENVESMPDHSVENTAGLAEVEPFETPDPGSDTSMSLNPSRPSQTSENTSFDNIQSENSSNEAVKVENSADMDEEPNEMANTVETGEILGPQKQETASPKRDIQLDRSHVTHATDASPLQSKPKKDLVQDESSESEEDEILEQDSTTFVADHIDDSMDGQRIAMSQRVKHDEQFGGFSPDTTLENQTFARDLSRDISRDFQQFATQTQETQRRSESVLEDERAPNSHTKQQQTHQWHGEFSLDSHNADTTVNFTRLLNDSLLVDEDRKVGELGDGEVLESTSMSDEDEFRDAQDSF
ncbi:hypothetical protein OXX79_003793 [Metschnikowia pulcherrima]